MLRSPPSLTVAMPADLSERLYAITKGELLLQYAAVLGAHARLPLPLYRNLTALHRGPMVLSGNGASGGVVSITVAVDDQLTFRQLLLDSRQAILDAYAEVSPPEPFACTLEVPGYHHSMSEAPAGSGAQVRRPVWRARSERHF